MAVTIKGMDALLIFLTLFFRYTILCEMNKVIFSLYVYIFKVNLNTSNYLSLVERVERTRPQLSSLVSSLSSIPFVFGEPRNITSSPKIRVCFISSIFNSSLVSYLHCVRIYIMLLLGSLSIVSSAPYLSHIYSSLSSPVFLQTSQGVPIIGTVASKDSRSITGNVGVYW